MNNTISILLIAILLIFTSSCACKKHTSKSENKSESTVNNLNGLYDIWGLKEMNGKALDSKREIVLELNTSEMTFMGNAHCNTISGKIESEAEGGLFFKNTIATRMACQELNQEQLYVGLLESVSSYQIKSLHLLLFNDSGELVLDFIKMD